MFDEAEIDVTPESKDAFCQNSLLSDCERCWETPCGCKNITLN